nr:MAG TPA: hypothetical protein [Caudoviricetes sp.]
MLRPSIRTGVFYIKKRAAPRKGAARHDRSSQTAGGQI